MLPYLCGPFAYLATLLSSRFGVQKWQELLIARDALEVMPL